MAKIVRYFLILFIVFAGSLMGLCLIYNVDEHHNDLLLMAGSWALVLTIRRFTTFRSLK